MSETNGKNENPPYSSTGVIRTETPGLIACVDWVGITFKNFTNYTQACEVLGLDFRLFEPMSHGLNGYESSVRFGNIIIMYGTPENTVNMGVHVSLSGDACREFEKSFNDAKDWSTFFALCLNFDVNFSRLDIAIDDFLGYLSFKTIIRKIKKAHLTTRFGKAINYEEFDLSTGNTIGQTIYFGKGKVLFRFYDKIKERINKGYSISADLDFWQRYEIQLSGDRAHAACTVLAHEAYEAGEFAKGIFSNYLNFKEPNKNDSNKRRWKNSPWWETFLGDVSKIQLSQVPPIMTIQKTKNWFEGQIAPVFSTLYDAFDQDIDLVYKFISEGRSKRSPKQKEMLLDFKENTAQQEVLKAELLQWKYENKVIPKDNNKKVNLSEIFEEREYKKALNQFTRID